MPCLNGNSYEGRVVRVRVSVRPVGTLDLSLMLLSETWTPSRGLDSDGGRNEQVTADSGRGRGGARQGRGGGLMWEAARYRN
jgi:hypothetical protein